ncbi:MAG: carbon-nitrogen hydrolase family protein [Betaproteobacteria bacterium]
MIPVSTAAEQLGSASGGQSVRVAAVRTEDPPHPPELSAESLRVAAVQMVSSEVVDHNLVRAGALIAEAASAGAQLVSLPEYFCLLGRRDTDKVERRESAGSGPIQDFLAEAARSHRVWVAGGTLPLRTSDRRKVRNTQFLFDPQGRAVARYDKIHLFGFQKDAERFNEADTIEAGDTPSVADAQSWRVGLSVCYDLRFPELYRALAPADLLLVPSAFTYTTGAAHWELLLRARAVENQCYVVAAAQGGRHSNGRRTFGHSMVVDPWGEVLACRAEGEGIVLASIRRERIRQVRTMLPALAHRRL